MSEKIAVCLDFDGILAHYTKWDGTIGSPIAEGKKLVQMLRDAGYKIVVQSCRTNPIYRNTEKAKQEMESWLRDNDIPFDEVFTDGKAFAYVYVDDRGVTFPSNRGPASTVFRDIEERIREIQSIEVEK